MLHGGGHHGCVRRARAAHRRLAASSVHESRPLFESTKIGHASARVYDGAGSCPTPPRGVEKADSTDECDLHEPPPHDPSPPAARVARRGVFRRSVLARADTGTTTRSRPCFDGEALRSPGVGSLRVRRRVRPRGARMRLRAAPSLGLARALRAPVRDLGAGLRWPGALLRHGHDPLPLAARVELICAWRDEGRLAPPGVKIPTSHSSHSQRPPLSSHSRGLRSRSTTPKP